MAQDNILATTVTIASGTTTAVIDLDKRVLVGVQTPASIASSALTINQAYQSDGTYAPVYDGLGQYGAVGDVTFTIASSKYVIIPPTVTAGIPFIKLVFGSTETAKTFIYYTREIN